MGYSKKVKLIQELLVEIPNLKQLDYRNDKYNIWKTKADVTIEELFGKDSIEYKNFQDIHLIKYSLPIPDKEKQGFYTYLVNTYERNLKSLIVRQKTKEDLKIFFRFQRFFRFIKKYLTKVFINIWQWIESHKIISILGAVASIATIIGVIITLLKD